MKIDRFEIYPSERHALDRYEARDSKNNNTPHEVEKVALRAVRHISMTLGRISRATLARRLRVSEDRAGDVLYRLSRNGFIHSSAAEYMCDRGTRLTDAGWAASGGRPFWMEGQEHDIGGEARNA